MKKILSMLLIVIMSVGFAISDASAKRFGGGRSFGMSRNVSSHSIGRIASPTNAASPMRRWLGPLAGLAIGSVIGSLLFGNGLGAGLLNMLLIGGLLFFVINWFRNRMAMATQPKAPVWMRNTAEETSKMYNSAQTNHASRAALQDYPADFHEETFLREMKKQFLDLQAAYDQNDLLKLRETTTPSVFSEIKAQLQERGDTQNRTEVVRLNMQLLDVVKEQGAEIDMYVASVSFSGLIKENNEEAAEFKEIWHLQKESADSRWLIAGIQQS